MMLPDELSVTKDMYGCDLITVSKEHLQNFEHLIAWIREKGYGSTTGILKVKLNEDDRQDARCVASMIDIMKAECARREMDPETASMEFVYNPQAQIAYKISVKDNAFQFVDAGCTKSERMDFVKVACKVDTYDKTSECCYVHLDDLEELRNHLFQEVEKTSLWSESLKKNFPQNNIDQQQAIAPIIYGADIPVPAQQELQICDGFSISSIPSVLDHLREKYEGITNPYLYSGSKHSFFPWHIEDGGLFSINYVAKGAERLWFSIAPQYFGLVDKIVDGMRLESHGACRARLANHKVLLADPQYFKIYHEVPYTMVLQQPGEFIITLPFSLHSGFNLGPNLAVSVNYGDAKWIEWGLYAPVCSCKPHQVKLDLKNVLMKCRPDLLHYYLHTTSLIFPEGHPRNVLSIKSSSYVNTLNANEPIQLGRIKDRTLVCPACKQTFVENRMNRLKEHIKRKHPTDIEHLWQTVAIKYPAWKPKSNRGTVCSVCSKFIRGNHAHIQLHHSKMHPKIPF